LVKLKIDFVNDLNKPNVKGYRATKVTVKTYQNQLYHQFKLERWMDYGPAIACAFASQSIDEITAVRGATLQCMQSAPKDAQSWEQYERATSQAVTMQQTQNSEKPYSLSEGNIVPTESLMAQRNNDVIRRAQTMPHETQYFQYDADTLAVDRLQSQQATGEADSTVARGRYSSFR